MDLLLIAGPCAVESREQLLDLAFALKDLGITHLRGGAYKPRTSPESFQGLGQEGLDLLQEAKEKTGMKIITEVVSPTHITAVAAVADFIQIGARNMHNYELLKELAQQAPHTAIILKRGLQATKKELIGSLNYLKKFGHQAEIIVCERGIRTFANGDYDRFTLDTALIADLTNDPEFQHKVIVDPSHPAGRSDLVANLAYAGIAAGAQGFIIELKRDGDTPLSDAEQALTIKEFKEVLGKVKEINKIIQK